MRHYFFRATKRSSFERQTSLASWEVSARWIMCLFYSPHFPQFIAGIHLHSQGRLDAHADLGTASFSATLAPDTAHNNTFDSQAACFFYRRCQELGVRLVIVSRHAAGACPVPRSMYDSIAQSRHIVALRLRAAQRFSIVALWKRACAPEGAKKRQNLPARCSRQWFLDTFCKGRLLPEENADEEVWTVVATFNMYDTLALVASVAPLRDRYFDCQVITSYHHRAECSARNGKSGNRLILHRIIGATVEKNGIKARGHLKEFMVASFKNGLRRKDIA